MTNWKFIIFDDWIPQDPIQKIIARGGIPDAAAIHAARKKREAMRAKGGKDDIIPLKSKSKRKENVKVSHFKLWMYVCVF